MRFLTTTALLLALTGGCGFAAESRDPVEVRFPRITAATQIVADAYIRAYFDKDWDALSELAAEAISFNDPTGKLVFGEPPPRHGKVAVLQSFRSGYASLEMRFSSLRSMYSGEHAFYEGTLAWDLNLPGRVVKSEVPMIVVLKVVDAKVISHSDFVDYQPFIDAEVASREPVAALDSPPQRRAKSPAAARSRSARPVAR